MSKKGGGGIGKKLVYLTLGGMFALLLFGVFSLPEMMDWLGTYILLPVWNSIVSAFHYLVGLFQRAPLFRGIFG